MNLIFQNGLLAFVIVMLWVLPWKIYAVWTAAKRGEKKWFIVLLLVNTLSILDIIYIFGVAKKTWADVHAVFNRKI